MRLVSTQLPAAVEPSPWLWVAAGALMLLVVLVVVLLVRRRRQNRAHETALARVHGLDGDIHLAMRELSAMIASAEQHLDARAERLERLIRAADERIERLRASAAGDGDRFARQSGGDADRNGDGNGDAVPAPTIVAQPVEVNSRHAQIYALNEEGLSTHQIAEQLGRPEGEVELILALRPRGRAVL